MVPVCCKQDQAVIGSQALSISLDICHGRVQKMERNLIERLPFLKDVFVSIDHPLSAKALTILPETPTEPPDLVGAVPKDVIPEPEVRKGERSATALFRCDLLACTIPSSASATSYRPSHLGPSFPVSSTRLASLLRVADFGSVLEVLRGVEISGTSMKVNEQNETKNHVSGDTEFPFSTELTEAKVNEARGAKDTLGYNAPGFIIPLQPNLGVLQIGFRAKVIENQGADEELSDGGSPRVIIYGYDGILMHPVAPPSLDYVPGPEYPPSPNYVPGPEHPPSPAE
ncbi:hypothetical protein Tco_0885974, partial [Tanacetum coccineum]